MKLQVPNFTNSMLNRVARGDLSVFGEGHDFTLTEYLDDQDWNALSVAATKGYLNLVNCLLDITEVRANAAAMDNQALICAALQGHLELVNHLLEVDEVKTKAAAYDNAALRGAAMNGHLEVVNRLLEIEAVMASAVARHNEALRLAAENGHLEVVNRLLEIEAVIENVATGLSHVLIKDALIIAASEGHLDVVNRLLEIESVRANAAASNNYALRWAAKNGHLQVVNRLLEINEVKENVTAEDNDGQTALRLAAANGHSEVVHALAKAQWPLGRQQIPEDMREYLPLIYEGAKLYAGKKEAERIWVNGFQDKLISMRTKDLYSIRPQQGNSVAKHYLAQLPASVVRVIADHGGYDQKSVAAQIQTQRYQQAWRQMRRSERLYGLFTNAYTRSREDQRALVVYKPQK